MKQIFNKKGKIIVENIPMPYLTEGKVLVSNINSLISSGSELISLSTSKNIFKKAIKKSMIKKVLDRIKKEGLFNTINLIKNKLENSIPLGYSSSGIVIGKKGEVGNINIGDRVACAGTGYANHAEIVCVPKNLIVKIPNKVSFEEAAFVALGGICIQGIRRADCKFGETITVIGLGLVGQITCQILNAIGCKVIGIDIDERRINIAKKLGLKLGFKTNVVQKVLKHTNNLGVDSVLICASTKNNEPLSQAIDMCRSRGKVIIIGTIGMDIKRHPSYEKELDFLMSCSYGPGRYDQNYEEKGYDYPIDFVRWTEKRNIEEFLNLIANKKINIKSLIGKIFDIDEAADAYESLKNSKHVAVLLKYKEDKKLDAKIKLKNRKVLNKEKINVGLIGCGTFAKIMHLPNLNRIKDYDVKALCSIDGMDAKKTAQRYNVDYCTADYKEILQDESIDMVMITTRHDMHVPITIEAAKNGKHIFVEKPMALNYKDCDKVVEAIKKSKVNYTVGFNRRYAPCAIKIKNYFEKKEGPCVVSYRINTEYAPKTHWFNDLLQGGGRIIGECGHFFDFINWFIGSKPISVSAKNISSNNEKIIDSNNIIVIIKYEDGSIANLIYTELGNENLEKERIEIFKDNSFAIIKDFKEIEVDGKRFNLRYKDKGHYNELIEFAKKLKNKKSKSLDLSNAYLATLCSLKAVDCLKTNRDNLKISE